MTDGTGDTYALVCDEVLTREQFTALTDLLWSLHPDGWPDGLVFTLSSGVTVRVIVEVNK